MRRNTQDVAFGIMGGATHDSTTISDRGDVAEDRSPAAGSAGEAAGRPTLAEVTLAETALDAIEAEQQPARVIADRACGSDPLREALANRGVDLTCPHRRKRTRPKTQDGRKLRRYRRRWIIERTFAWLGNSRRLVVRWERRLVVYRALFHLACCFILLRWL